MATDTDIDLLDVVALTTDLPEHQLHAGQVGTVVERLDNSVFEVEFSDENGRTYATAPVETARMLRLHFKQRAS